MLAEADIEARLASASDEEVMRLHEAMRIVRDTARWAEIARGFPAVDADTWPIDYGPVLAWREATIALVAKERLSHKAIRAWYSDNRPHEFIEHWGTTYDPRNAKQDRPVKMPMLLFHRQREYIDFLLYCLAHQRNGLAEKVRDFGLTWLSAFVAVWLWATWEEGPAIGFGSRKEDLVDKLGDVSSIFEKIRMAIRGLPPFLKPEGLSESDHLTFMKCINPETGAAITGESGDSVGRGGRTLCYFKDESAHYARPELIEAALADNTNVQIDISTPNGLGNVFHRRREAGHLWTPGVEMERGTAAVFVADWREHPGKSQAWYDERKQTAIDEGLLHVFKQEVDRDYAASVEGVIIPAEWVKSAIDAHITLAHLGDWYGPWRFALDVADGGGDTNALVGFRGSVLSHAESWGERDTGRTTNRALTACSGKGRLDLQFDCVGVGAGVKAEWNRLADEDLIPDGINLIPWNAGAAVQNKDSPINPDDPDSPTNGAMFYNFKAQAHWNTRLKFERTHRAVTEGIVYDPSELIGIDSTLPLLRQIEKELSQPTAIMRPADRKLIVDKKPEGTKSPNVGDALVMADNPAVPLAAVYTIAPNEISVDPFPIPSFWPKGYALKVEGDTVFGLFAAYDRMSDIIYFTTEHRGIGKSLSDNAAAVKARGDWMPGTLETDEVNEEARMHMLAVLGGYGLTNLMLADKSFDAGIAQMDARLKTGRLKAFSTVQEFWRGYRTYRRDEKGDIAPAGIMDCARLIAGTMAIRRMIERPKTTLQQVPVGGFAAAHRGDSRVGY